MAPIPEWIHAVLHHQQVLASEASFTEKAIVLLVVGHILVFYTALCWLGASTISGEPHREDKSLPKWGFKLIMPIGLVYSRQPRSSEE